MKLVKLTLDCWRGIDHCDIDFSDEVTLIEGPNEIGKSTIVEAVYTLFKEMDSSSKQAIKSIQPVGQDVGSRIEAEVITGRYHFVYEKTYNKGKQTALRILEPSAEQLTGREGHERAGQILDETIDLVLWNALLVEQGKEITRADLSNSTGLARALDAAAGTAAEASDDSALFGAIQAEYEQYFTLKTGKPRFAQLEDEVSRQREQVAAAEAALAEVEDDSAELERMQKEVRRLQEAMPGLESSVAQQEAAWKEVEALKETVKAKKAELVSATEIHESAKADLQRRETQKTQLAESETKLADLRKQLEPKEDQLKALQQTYDDVSEELKTAGDQHRQARQATERAKADEAHLRNCDERAALEKRLAQVDQLNNELAATRAILAEIKIDENKLKALREAERNLQIAMAKRDASALSIDVTAERDLTLLVDDQAESLSEGDKTNRTSAAELNIQIEGVASIRISPSQSASELESAVNEQQREMDRLLASAGVRDLAEAITAESRRLEAEREAKRCSQKIAELLEGESQTDRQSRLDDLKRAIESWLAERPDDPPLPGSVSEAEKISHQAQQHLTEIEEKLSGLQSKLEAAREARDEHRGDLRVKEEECRGLATRIEDQKQQLGQAAATESNEALHERVKARLEKCTSLTDELEGLEAKLAGASPESVQDILENARATLRRAEKDLQDAQQQCAVLEDRLAKAQADGRFEAFESAAFRLEALEAEYAATLGRATAAKRLWETISGHRDSARRAYVKPLKDGIEKLGKIVFGGDFEVELDDSWQLVSRTLAGKTIPFDDLSVGAREQLGILTRLAAAGIVATEGGVPIIIDDALGFSDPGRLETMGTAIASAGKDCQVILLTCTPGRFMHVGNADVVKL